MKKRFWIGLAAAAAALVIGFVVFIFIEAKSPAKLDLNVEPVTSVNYNNYYDHTRLDYKGGELAWQSSFLFNNKLTMLDGSGETSVLSGISAPFQLLEDRVVYEKNGDLMCRMRSTGEDELLASHVGSFLAVEDGVLYLSGTTLHKCYWSGQHATLGQGLLRFYYHHDTLYALNGDQILLRLESDGTWREQYTPDWRSWPIDLKFHGDHGVYTEQNQLCFFDLTTGDTETVRFTDRKHVNDRFIYICDDERLFVSFYATETDGSIVNKVEHPDNGVWRVDVATGEVERLCDKVFDRLYLFEGNRLFGVMDNDLFQIDVYTGQVTRVSG